MLKPTLLALMTASLVASAAPAQTTHDHAAMMARESTTPTEPGQGAFAAIAEIVALLTADPGTNWARVDIDALRQHLVDMDNLVTFAEVTRIDLSDGAEFRVRLDGPAGAAARRMVPAHAPVLAAETGWSSEALVSGEVIVWTVRSTDQADAIRALGFFGLMALGNHHPVHHFGMATGRMMH